MSLIDDFDNQLDDPNYQTSLGAVFCYYISVTNNFYGAGYWFAYDDSPEGGTSVATPDYIQDKAFEGGFGDGEVGKHWCSLLI